MNQDDNRTQDCIVVVVFERLTAIKGVFDGVRGEQTSLIGLKLGEVVAVWVGFLKEKV